MTIKQIDDLMSQAATPLQQMILLGQLMMLRQRERIRNQQGQTSAEALLVIFLALAVLLASFTIGIATMAVIDATPAGGVILSGLPLD